MNIVFVTGANSGMGFEIVKKLSSRKDFIIFAGYRSEGRSEALIKLASNIDNIIAIKCDVNSYESVTNAFSEIASKYNKLDILINNAGYGYVSLLEHYDEEQLFNQFDTNVFGPIRCIKQALPLMRNSGRGHIINITSFLGKMGLPYLSIYNASKYALEGLTESLRYELAPFNIKVSSIAPGLFKTGFANSGAVVQEPNQIGEDHYDQKHVEFIGRVVSAINSGSSPELIAQSIDHSLSIEDNLPTLNVGEDAVLLLDKKKELPSAEFEKYLSETFEIEYPMNITFTF